MADYKQMYLLLCKSVDDAIEPLLQIQEAKPIAEKLWKTLLEAEEIYINTDEQ